MDDRQRDKARRNELMARADYTETRDWLCWGPRWARFNKKLRGKASRRAGRIEARLGAQGAA